MGLFVYGVVSFNHRLINVYITIIRYTVEAVNLAAIDLFGIS